MKNLFLRKAEVSDDEFLREVSFDVRSQEFVMNSLPIEVLNSLLSMQYNSQKETYERQYPNAESFIIEFEGARIGRLLINREAEKVHLVDISILHNFRNLGIGSFLLEKLKSEAKLITLNVYKMNFGAIRLYEKQGFFFKEDNGMYFKMEWENVG